jgi:hypothetical protein
MLANQSPKEIWVAFQVGIVDEKALVEWACNALVSMVPLVDHRTALALASLSKEEAGGAAELMRELVCHADPAFDLRSSEGERIAKAELRRQCERYLAGEIRPYELCRLVTPIEHLFDFPDWLGALYNVCDWIEPETPREEVPHLEEEVRRRYRALGAEADSP